MTDNVLTGIVLWPILAFFSLMETLHDANKISTEWTTAVIGTLLWVVAPILLLIYLGII